MTPKWLTPVALVAFFTGLAIVVFGPPLLYAVAAASVDAELEPEQLTDQKAVADFMAAKTKNLVERFFWVFPVGGAVGFSGMIALILVWVSRPLGDDEDRRAEQESAAGHSAAE